MALFGKKEEDSRPGLFRLFRNRFFTGVVIALPIAVTAWLITKFITMVDEFVLKYLPAEWNPNTWISEQLGFGLPGFGLIIAIFALWFLGVIASNFIGNSILKFGERLLNRVPLFSNIYNGLKQIVGTIAAQKDQAFKEVCLIEYPRKGLWAIGFVTSDLQGAPRDHLAEDYVCVFVPTTPNPTSGFLLFVRRNEVKILDMTPEEGAKMIISGGMVTSNEEAPEPERRGFLGRRVKVDENGQLQADD